MKILVCDDEEKAYLQLREILLKIASDHNLYFDIDYCDNNDSCRECVKRTPPDVIFMDIYIGGHLGTKLAMELQQYRKNYKLVFLTSSNEFASESFEAGASYYVLKPADYNKIETALEHCGVFAIRTTITIDTSKGILNINPHNIMAVEVFDKYCHIRTTNGVMKELCPFSKFVEQLGEPDFLQINRSCLINLNFVDCQNEDYFQMKDGTIFEIKQRGSKAIKDKYIKWLFDNM